MHELYVQIYLVLLHYHRGIRTVGAIDIHTVLCLMMQCAAAQNCSILAELHLRCHDVARYEFSHLDENQALRWRVPCCYYHYS